MAIVISVVVLVLSLSAFLHGRWRDRRDLLLRIHEYLLAADQQRGRRLVYRMKEKQISVKDLTDDEYVLINNALASLNLLAIYYQRGYVRRKDVLELWALPVVRVLQAGTAFLAHRDAEQGGVPIWQQLREFGKDSEKYAQRVGMPIRPVEGLLPKQL